MPSTPPKKNASYAFYVGLLDQTNTKLLLANPSIASGDFQVSIDGGAFANLITTPTVTPAAGRSVKIQLAASEMNGDEIVVVGHRVADSAWCDIFIGIETSTHQIDDLLNQDAQTQPAQGAPPASATLVQQIGYLYKAWRNRTTQTASTYALYADDSVTVDHKAAFTDDGTTADRAKIATGP